MLERTNTLRALWTPPIFYVLRAHAFQFSVSTAPPFDNRIRWLLFLVWNFAMVASPTVRRCHSR